MRARPLREDLIVQSLQTIDDPRNLTVARIPVLPIADRVLDVHRGVVGLVGDVVVVFVA